MLPRPTRQHAAVTSALCACLVTAAASAQANPSGAANAQASTTATTSGTATEAPPAGTADAAPSWALQHRRYATRNGSTGGMYVNDPGGGEPGAVRLQLFFDVRPASDFLGPDLETSQNRQTLAVSWTALRALELYGSLYGQGTLIGGTTVSTVHVNGGQLGFKLFTEAGPWAFGGGARIELIDGLGNQASVFDGTSVGLNGNASLDLRRTSSGWPLVARLSAEYLFDNRAQIMESTEAERYAMIDDPLAADSDDRHLLTRAERYALGVNRLDTLNVGLGVEVPLEVATDFFLHPMLEWRVGLPINRQGYDCPTFVNRPDAGTPESDTDECLAIAGAAAWPMSLSIGLRVVPPARGLSIAIAADLGLTGTSMFVHELSPTAPFSLGVAVGYDYDARPVPVPPSAPVATAAAAPEGRVRGLVSDGQSGQPLADVIVTVHGSELGPVATSASGEFTSYALPAGDAQLDLRHADYEPGQCAATIPTQGGEVRVACALTKRAAPPSEPAAAAPVPAEAPTSTPSGATPVPAAEATPAAAPAAGAPAQPTTTP